MSSPFWLGRGFGVVTALHKSLISKMTNRNKMDGGHAKKSHTTDEMNLLSVRRLDPSALFIVDKSTHAALYSFNTDERRWVKTGIEGPVFIYKRSDHPSHSIIIANRQSLSDYIEPISSSLHLDLQKPYIFIRKAPGSQKGSPEDNGITGLWFYQEKDCVRIYNLLKKLTEESDKSSGTNAENKVDLLSLLSPSNKAAESNKESNGMPELLQTIMQLPPSSMAHPNLPVEAVSAEEFEKMLVCSSRRDSKTGNNNQKVNNENHHQIAPTYSSTSLGALSTTAVEGSEKGANDDDIPLSMLQKADAVTNSRNYNGSGDVAVAPSAMTKEQLVQALDHLLKTDDDFVSRLHKAYVDSINRRLGL